MIIETFGALKITALNQGHVKSGALNRGLTVFAIRLTLTVGMFAATFSVQIL